MKTFLVMYMLAFVSIIVIYVQDQSTPVGETFNPRLMAAQMMQMQERQKKLTIKARPDRPDAAVTPKKARGADAGIVRRADLPEIVDFDHYPHTFEGLDQKIKELSVSAKKNPDLYVNIAECYNHKAGMYMARIRGLLSIKSGGESKSLSDELERKRVESLKLALGALNKTPRCIYRNTDTRLIKANIYRDLPGQEHKAVPELQKLADDPDALPKLRDWARAKLGEHKSRK